MGAAIPLWSNLFHLDAIFRKSNKLAGADPGFSMGGDANPPGEPIYDFAKQKSILGPFCAVLFGNIGEYGNEINGLKQDISTDFEVDFSPL